MNRLLKIPGSFKDPAAEVYQFNNRIIRTIKKQGAKRYEFMDKHGILKESINKGFLIATKDITNEKEKLSLTDCVYLLEHEKIKYISYPYEWGFYQLQSAALHHLNFQIFLLERNAVLIDASAYNIQFNGNTLIN